MRNEFYKWVWKSKNRWNYIHITIKTGVNPIIISKIAHGMDLYHPCEKYILELLKRKGVVIKKKT